MAIGTDQTRLVTFDQQVGSLVRFHARATLAEAAQADRRKCEPPGADR